MKDLGSKYTSMCNGNKLTPNMDILLENNAEIKFGLFKAVYR